MGLCAALVSGCFSQKFAEGFYVEEVSSGRWQAYNKWRLISSDPMHFLRLRLVQFDQEVGGIVEVFRVSEYTTFASQPLTITRPRPDYFCTRLEYATSRDEKLVLRFTDQASRRWQLDATYESDQLEGSLSRVTARGEVLSRQEAAARGLLWDEDRWYTDDEALAQSYRPLTLKREREEIEAGFLECVNHHPRQELRVRLPSAPPPGAKLGLIMTRPERAVSGAGPAGVSWEEVATTTLDDIDLVNDERAVLLRAAPTSSFVRAGVGVGTWIVYEDLPDADGKRNGRWDASGPSPDPVWAVAQQRVVVYREDNQWRPLIARDVHGDLIGACDAPAQDACLWDDATPSQGWTMYEYAASDEVLPDGDTVWLLRKLSGGAGGVVELRPVEPACATCATSHAGQPRPGCEGRACPPVLPVLFL
jgi:hypothetical protein